MFAKSFVALAAVASFAVAAPLEKKGAPAGWAYGYLEDYDTYHVRYLALKCYDQKNTDFFQDCCRPMLSTENLKDNRKAYCVPSSDDHSSVVSSLSVKATAGAASATASADQASESEYCDTEESASSAAPTNTKVAAAYSSYASSAVAVASSAAPAPAAASSSAAAVQYVAPVQSSKTSTSTTPAWTPAPTTSTTPAWTPAPAPTTTAAASNNNGQSFNGGFATYFYQGGNAGACGTVHSDWDMIVAIDHEQWGSSSYGSGSNTCGRWLTVTNTKNGKSVVAMVADVCPTCANGNSLDLSQGAFNAIATEAEGSVPISWHWN